MSGLARNSWKWLKDRVKRGGRVNARSRGTSLNVGAVEWFGDNVTIRNKLGYIQDALIGGSSSVDLALLNAAKSFKWKVDELLGLHEIKTQ